MAAPKLNIVFCGICEAALGALKLKPPLLGSLFCCVAVTAGLPKANSPPLLVALTSAGFGVPKALLPLTEGEPNAEGVVEGVPKTAVVDDDELPKRPVDAGAGLLLLALKVSLELKVIVAGFFSSCF